MAQSCKLVPVHIGKGLPMLAYSWISGKGQLVLLDKLQETLIMWGMRFYTITETEMSGVSWETM